MYSAKAIANYFLDKADGERTTLTPMKIIKLVYIAHGWHLALTDKPLIKENVEAWIYGPVIPELYHEFKKYGNTPIQEYAMEIMAPVVTSSPPDLPFSIEQFLDRVWEVYKRFTAIELSQMTHQENTPWDRTIKTSSDKTDPRIPDDLIRDYYKDPSQWSLIHKPG